ncbi:response regulator [Promicromonospora sp. NPDC057138]|uniref:response regulator n=1 Tax=Promicromonospora sp. NPDC057138 TaxID=3346031 RepID=UPI00362C4684
MPAVADLIGAVASLLWPLLVIVVLLVFGRQLLSKLRNSDDVTLEIGGQRLNFKQATDQQSDMITDLQREVASLKRRLDYVDSVPWGDGAVRRPESGEAERAMSGDDPGATSEEFVGGAVPRSSDTSWMQEEQERRISVPAPRSILWVDDHPENNAMLAESWRRDGVEIETARSTSEALRMLGGRTYGLVISDVGRREADVDVPDAGLRLLTKVRETNPVLPFVLYGNTGSFADDVRAAGATKVTDSTFELVDFATGLGLLDGV